MGWQSEKGTSHKIVTLLLVSMRWQITDGQARTDSYENSLGDSGSLGISRVHLDRNTMISRWSMKLLILLLTSQVSSSMTAPRQKTVS